MHLNDAIGRVDGIKFICNHHEQASAIAAEGYARVANKPLSLMLQPAPAA
jgi:acetolactate synthase-1/2/3 large subunit